MYTTMLVTTTLVCTTAAAACTPAACTPRPEHSLQRRATLLLGPSRAHAPSPCRVSAERAPSARAPALERMLYHVNFDARWGPMSARARLTPCPRNIEPGETAQHDRCSPAPKFRATQHYIAKLRKTSPKRTSDGNQATTFRHAPVAHVAVFALNPMARAKGN